MLSKTIARNSLILALDQCLALAMTLATAGLVARVLGPATMGHYAFAMWIAMTMSSFASFAVGGVMTRYVAEFVGSGELALAKSIVRMCTWVQAGFCSLMVSIGLLYVWLRIPEGQQLYNALIMISIFPSLMRIIPTAINMAAEDFGANLIPSIASILLHPVGVYLALGRIPHTHLHGMEWGLTGLATGLLLSRTADWLLRLWWSRHKLPASLPKAAIPPELWTRIWRYLYQSTMLLALNLVVWERCELAFLKEFSTSAQMAFYGSSFTITGLLAGLPGSFAGACGASLMVQRGRDPGSLNRMVAIWLRLAALLVFPLFLGMAALSGPAVHLIYGRRYEQMIPVLALMAVMGIPKALSAPAMQLMQAREKQGALVYWMIVAATVTVTLDYLLIRYCEALGQGSIGAALGNGIAQIVAATGIWMFVVQKEHLVLPWSALGRLTASAGLMALAAYFAASPLRQLLLLIGVPALSIPLLVPLIIVPIGALLYAFLLKITRSFDAEDRTRLGKLESYFPASLRPWYGRGLQWIMT